jgi:hypothetical protein
MSDAQAAVTDGSRAGWQRPIMTAVIASLLWTAICFRLMYLSTMPGISGDEGWFTALLK